MSYYEVPRPAPPRIGLIEALAAVLVLTAAVVLAVAWFTSVPVTVDDARRRIPLGTPVAELAELGLTEAIPGDLLAASDGRVLAEGGGKAPALVVDGRPALPGERIDSAVVVESVDGADVVEEVEESTEPIAIPVRYEGDGSLVSISRTGQVGSMRVSRGAVSGQVLRTSVVAEPAPMVFTRQRPAPGDRVVALTFDDGPWPGQTEAVLEVLEKADAPATFFMLGVQVVAHPDLARAVVDAGHVVGNHTQSHPILRRARAERCLAEIEAAQRTIERATGVDPEWFRPAGGLVGPGLFEAADEASVRVVGWTIDPQDWTGAGADEIAANVLKYLHPGAVILLHDGGGDRGPTIEALPAIIDGIRERGYTLIGMDEYPGAPSPTPTG